MWDDLNQAGLRDDAVDPVEIEVAQLANASDEILLPYCALSKMATQS